MFPTLHHSLLGRDQGDWEAFFTFLVSILQRQPRPGKSLLGNPSTHRGVRLVDRKNPQPMDIATVAEVS